MATIDSGIFPNFSSLDFKETGGRTAAFVEKHGDKILIISLLAAAVILGSVLTFGAVGFVALPMMVVWSMGAAGAFSMTAAAIVGIAAKVFGQEQSSPKREVLGSSPDSEVQKIRARLSEISTKEELNMTPIKGAGGHGGMYAGEIEVDGCSKPLFLKPKDEVEFRNYQIIERLAPDVAAWMPKFYGEVQIDGCTYLVLENISLPEPEDAKLSAQPDISEASFNPIADQEEWGVTRGKTKSTADYGQMLVGAKVSPGYMIAQGDRKTRLLRYGQSKEYLKGILTDPKKHTLESLVRIKGELLQLQEAMKSCPIGFIGASILLSAEGIKLIDPAHIVVDPSEREWLSDLNTDRIYFGGERCKQYKESNVNSIRALIDTIDEAIDQPLDTGWQSKIPPVPKGIVDQPLDTDSQSGLPPVA